MHVNFESNRVKCIVLIASRLIAHNISHCDPRFVVHFCELFFTTSTTNKGAFVIAMIDDNVKHTIMPHVETSPVISAGWLYKMKRSHSKFFKPDWGKRWFVMNHSISWRHSKNHAVAGSIDLSNVTSVYKVNQIERGKKRERKNSNEESTKRFPKFSLGRAKKEQNESKLFVIKSSSRSLCLMAKDPAECDRWVKSIQLQLDIRNRKRSPRKPVGDKYDQFESILKDLDDSLPINKLGREIMMKEESVKSTWNPRTHVAILDDYLNGNLKEH